MEHIGIDIHKRESQICILTPEGEIIERRIQSTRDRFTAVFKARARARVLLEATTESEWVAQTLEACGHEVIVADPNYAPMYPERRRRVKTDRRDARMLAEAARVGSYRSAHRVSAEQRQVRRQLRVRDLLVRARGRTISLIRALVRSEGLRRPGGECRPLRHLRAGAHAPGRVGGDAPAPTRRVGAVDRAIGRRRCRGRRDRGRQPGGAAVDHRPGRRPPHRVQLRRPSPQPPLRRTRLEPPTFRAFLRHRSTLVAFLRQAGFVALAARQPPGTGSAQIVRRRKFRGIGGSRVYKGTIRGRQNGNPG